MEGLEQDLLSEQTHRPGEPSDSTGAKFNSRLPLRSSFDQEIEIDSSGRRDFVGSRYRSYSVRLQFAGLYPISAVACA